MIDIIYRFDPDNPTLHRLPTDPDDACRILESGNRDFASFLQAEGDQTSRIIPLDLRDIGWGEEEGKAPSQAPFAAVLGCSDARVPTEMVFNQQCNDIFVVRVAGNVLGTECLGSLHYAVHHFENTLKLLIVLGHTHCSAVAAAVDAFLTPKEYHSLAPNFPLRTIVDQILFSVREATLTIQGVYGLEALSQPGYREAVIELSVVLNTARTAFSLQEEFRSYPAEKLRVAFGIYDLASRYIRLPLSPYDSVSPEEIGLTYAPKNGEEFREMTEKLTDSEYIRRLLYAL